MNAQTFWLIFFSPLHAIPEMEMAHHGDQKDLPHHLCLHHLSLWRDSAAQILPTASAPVQSRLTADHAVLSQLSKVGPPKSIFSFCFIPRFVVHHNWNSFSSPSPYNCCIKSNTFRMISKELKQNKILV